MGHEVFTKKKKVKLGHFYCQEREGRFNSLNFNWIENIVSLSGCVWLGHFFQLLETGNISALTVKYRVPSIFYCYQNKSIWSWSKFLQFYGLSSPRLHMKSHYPRTSWVEESVHGCQAKQSEKYTGIVCLLLVMEPVMPVNTWSGFVHLTVMLLTKGERGKAKKHFRKLP